MLNSIKSFVITFCVAILIFGLVAWFVVGRVSETFGLVETVEKAAQIYMMTEACGGAKNLISDDQLKLLAKRFNLTYRDGVI